MKKRIFLFLALAAALLLLTGAALAETDDHVHWAWCDAPDVCAECGEPYTGSDICHYWDVQSDDTCHWWICTRCGVEEDKEEHWAYCDYPTVCVQCGATSNISYVVHDWNWDDAQTNDTYHWWICTRCGEELYKNKHGALCDNPTVCAVCGSTNNISDVYHEFYPDDVQSDDTYHWWICTRCGEECNRGTHWALCDNPTVCADCGATGNISYVAHDWDWDNMQSDDTYHWRECGTCGAKSWQEHWAYCDNPTVCADCGAAGNISVVYHSWNLDEVQTDDTYHWWICDRCGEEIGRGEHRAYCDNPTVCADCGFTGKINAIWHYSDADDVRFNDTYHWWICPRCGEGADGKFLHEFDEQGYCYVCGYQWEMTDPTETPVPPTEEPVKPTETPVPPTEEPVKPTETPVPPTEEPVKPTETPVPPTEEPPHEHVWVVTEEIPATCTEKGSVTSACDCGATKTEEIPALGHVYDTYTSDGAGSHSAACVRCDEIVKAACSLEETMVNGLKAGVCPRCGYTVSMAASIAPVPETGVLNAMIEVGESANIPQTAAFTVYDMTSALPEDSGAAYAFLVTLTDNGAEIALSGKVRVSIPWTQDLTGMKLLLVRLNGETVEIEYELIDGKLTFTLEELGFFVFAPAQA